ncbi:MAG: iron complex transport system ATP-binding protein [Sphingomonadales bacterium]|nr:iron complex transport system ATP-binding protein [Sphingomonadales bacterium]
MIRAEDIALAGRLQPLSLELERDALVCLVGPNGSGKTSLLHALAGIGGPAGRVEIDGMEVASAPRTQRAGLLSFLPASRDIHWPLAGRDVIALSGASAAQIDAAIAMLELGPLAGRRMDRLSTGERSRILLARALAPKPALLLLDEPTANLDPLWQIRLLALLRGRTALVAMHDLDAAAAHADRLLVMDKGRVAADGRPADVMAGPAIGDVFGIERVEGKWRALGPG